MDRRTFLAACGAIAVAGPALAQDWGPRGYVSLAYDDGLDSQLDIAVPQLESAGLRGTFFVTLNNIVERANEWAALPRRGHELANHTVSHPCDLTGRGVSTYAAREIDPVQDWLTRVEGPAGGRDFAYPCDVTDLGAGTPNQQMRRYERLLRRSGMFSARTSEGPPNSPWWVRHAPYRLQALALAYNTAGLDDVANYLAEAIRRQAWAILVVHEIGDGERKDGFISSAEHSGLIQMVLHLKVPCGTVQTAIRALGRGFS